jgi:hypothetical protein
MGNMFPLDLYNYFEIAAFVISLICWLKLRRTNLQWLMPYLFFMLIVELTGRYIGRELKGPIGWIFNISVPIEYLFFSFLYYINYTNKFYKRIAFGFIVCFSIFVFAYSIIESIENFHPVYLKIGSITMIVFSCFYLAEILRIGTIINPLKIPMFWIACGLLLFNAGEFISNFLMDFLFKNQSNWAKMFRLVNNNLIVVLYSCISVAIIIASWARREKV